MCQIVTIEFMLSFVSLTVDACWRQRRDNVDFATYVQIAQGLSNVFSVIVIALGYYALIRVTQKSVEEMRAQRLAGGRPMVIVDDNYNDLPEIDIVIRNMQGGPAKDISFEFSEPVESSDGFVLSELPFFKEGMTSLAPGAKIGCYWDTLDNLLPLIKEGKIASDISVTVR